MSVSLFDPKTIRNDFPTLNQTINGYPLVYLDSAATTQKPQCVIDATNKFYTYQNANVHRGRHTLSEQATTAYELVRQRVADYFQVSGNEIVWTKGATEAINLVAHGLRNTLTTNDTILISPIEHHANIVPWQELAAYTGATLKVLPLNDDATFDINQCCDVIKLTKPALLAVTQASNALGNITDLTPLITAAKAVDALTLVDGAQSALHLRPNLTKLDCDFYVFSAHKMLGPTGLGGLYGRYSALNTLSPYQTGGEMIEKVTLTQSTYRDAPAKFEAGTPNIAGVLGFGAALEYLMALDQQTLKQYEQQLFIYAANALNQIDGISIYSDLKSNIGTLCFNYKNEHPYDLATLLDGYGVAVRSGHHCTQPLMTHLKLNGSLRASFAFYNTTKDVDQFITALKECIALLD
ncbi:SufS family cysteine desulfurase [Pseudoalteromonas sp. Scap03]|uniref:aminotransferase class V-fold PLP-dependent enzyme n=1 Tax=unclassified Pseudoalteromonas TaxID=194690 RepID=UPI0015C04843|nr:MULTISPECIES: SufS family cysteine desulfurase [unclassified Pseudoalteromonas]NWL16427.1 SufS family cysteine desulfurase [Pseudoalteromonas sp. Scap03]QLE81543.1 SufS family cysteine desulfurase [Pseudoalteromonas sp. Scap25]QLE89487.1 SufS family cysteine desulfurase [Pseudoalteromonas sp. Scap06]